MNNRQTVKEAAYNLFSPMFTEVGASHKVDARTRKGKGILKDEIGDGILDAFTEELVYHIANQLEVPCVYTRCIQTTDGYATFSRYEADLGELMSLSELVQEQAMKEVTFEDILKYPEQMKLKGVAREGTIEELRSRGVEID